MSKWECKIDNYILLGIAANTELQIKFHEKRVHYMLHTFRTSTYK